MKELIALEIFLFLTIRIFTLVPLRSVDGMIASGIGTLFFGAIFMIPFKRRSK